MKVLGLDPGTRRCGYCLIEVDSSSLSILTIGTWNLNQGSSTRPLGERLERLSEDLAVLLDQHNPRIVGLEKAVAFKNIPSALTLSEARGVLRLGLYQKLSAASERLIELSPTEIKRVATGSGASNKASVQKVLSMRFQQLSKQINDTAFSSDAFDALAIAWTAWIVHNKRNGIKARPQIRPEGSIRS